MYAIRSYYAGCEVLYIGTERKVEKTALAGLGFTIMTIRSQGIKGKSLPAKMKAVLQQPYAFLESARIIRSYNFV